MINRILVLVVLLHTFTMPLQADEEIPHWVWSQFDWHVERVCKHEYFVCDERGGGWVKIRYVGDDFKTSQLLTVSAFHKFNRMFNRRDESTPVDELKKKKHHMQMLDNICSAAQAGCFFALTRVVLFWPGVILTMTCSAGTGYCKIRTQEEIEKINEQLENLKEKPKFTSDKPLGSSGSGPIVKRPGIVHGGFGTPTVTINDNPGSNSGNGIDKKKLGWKAPFIEK